LFLLFFFNSMKTSFLSAFVLATCFSATALAHDIHNVASDHTHPAPVYTHSVSSAYDHNSVHLPSKNHYSQYNYGYSLPKVTTNTATYYTRNYPVSNTYTYLTTPNTGIHYPPFAYSSCANNCNQTQKRITVTSNIGTRAKTYRAPSEYSAQQTYIPTPVRNNHVCTNHAAHSTTYVSPYQTHKLTTSTCYGCGH